MMYRATEQSVDTYIHTYNNNSYIITYITFGPLPRFAVRVWRGPVSTRFLPPVSAFPSVHMRQKNVSCRLSIRHCWGSLRDSIRRRWSKVIMCLMLSLQKRSKTDPSLERPPKKTSRPRPKTHPLRADLGHRKRFVFLCF